MSTDEKKKKKKKPPTTLDSKSAKKESNFCKITKLKLAKFQSVRSN